jgi:hypothetical protein
VALVRDSCSPVSHQRPLLIDAGPIIAAAALSRLRPRKPKHGSQARIAIDTPSGMRHRYASQPSVQEE